MSIFEDVGREASVWILLYVTFYAYTLAILRQKEDITFILLITKNEMNRALGHLCAHIG